MPRIDRTPQLEEDLLEIGEYGARHNPQAALRLMDEFDAKFQTLAENPQIGQRCPGLAADLPADLRQFPAGDYVIFYRPTAEGIVLYRVLHGRRDIPRVFRDESLDEPD